MVRRTESHFREVESRQQGELLQEHRSLRPRSGLVDLVSPVLQGGRCLHGGLPGREVLSREQAPVVFSGGVEHGGTGQERVDGLGDESLVEGTYGGVHLGFAARGGGVGLGHEAPEGLCQGRVAKPSAGRRGTAVDEIGGTGFGPVLPEEGCDRVDEGGGPGRQRKALLRIADGRSQYVRHAQSAPVSQQPHPGAEGTRYHGGQQTGAGNGVQTETTEVVDVGAGGHGALAADHLHGVGGGVVDDDRDVTARSVEVWFDDLDDEGGGGGGVEGVAAALKHLHPRGRSQPVCGGDGTEGAVQVRSMQHGDVLHLMRGRDWLRGSGRGPRRRCPRGRRGLPRRGNRAGASARPCP